MFDKIIAYSIKHKFLVGLFVFALIIWGSYSFKNLPIDALPDITNNQVQILTSAPNLATQEVELFITYPIELAVKSIPNISELRSVSRFGLSIVTVVFEEHIDIYWARNQINERLSVVENEIPSEYGRPELAPISTGLGEIFQYTVVPEDGYEDQYNAMDLRSIQDWIIVPQLIGTKGIAEVNTLGGILKEYEVAVNPSQLKSMGVTITEVFEALQNNNENTGGAYIDKQPYAYFIRSIGMVNSLEDISKIVIKTSNDIPILIRDIAKVQYGNTVRYGACTKDGKGETVNGMVMMLKGENSAEIVNLVKDKIEKITSTLPEGIAIVPYLDRSKLVNGAISTVRNNLIEGALIVIFILVLLIGNWRAGLIVASVIPLALLFAVSLMKLFGVSGNLMSLGAIDFGLIVDGAVIIVESIVHRLQKTPKGTQLTAAQIDEEVYAASSNIRSSAAFGEIIILIVYLPILALVGIEGKMFTPMAQTVSFAILGAFILSLTYVPMMSAWLLGRHINHERNLSDKIIDFFQSLYNPVLRVSMKFKKSILIAAVILFAISLYIFSTLGGEFIPTLSEGDIATHVMIPPGSSLSQEILSTTKAEQLLLENFPEIEQIVSKIGSAEVPTDPMPMEVADVIIIMKDKSEWTSASSKEEMFKKMEEVLDDLPGVTTEFSQPIQMRFNELMTGVRSDVGIKVFGDDIERLVALGDQIEAIAKNTRGVVDARAEAVSGFPQITIKYDKDKLALYGLNVTDLNKTLSMGFAGSKAGVVYEKEKKFDLVIRLDEEYRQDISHIENLYVNLPSGNQIPMDQVAKIALEKGPAQISRENGKRRITVGFNCRDRDIENTIEEIKSKLNDQVKLPIGYYIEYAGQFENLERAKERLSIAIPLALGLIFVLLYFTFNSIKQSILIFTAIPLSAIGGIFALWLRDMPFSISAGIGFIALFGVAVLNGIVLISYFNQLKAEGVQDIYERIKTGTKVRLRPVIMTAMVASFGFLPMALSTSAGAEVQKPLATVVIGGLLTATLLTLIILPIIYYYSERKKTVMTNSNLKVGMILIIFCFSLSANTQNEIKNLDQAIEQATLKSNQLKGRSLELEKQQQLKQASNPVPKTEFAASLGQMNTNEFDQSYSISQRFNPFVSKARKATVDQQMIKSKIEMDLTKKEIILSSSRLWNDLLFYNQKLQLIYEHESLVKDFSDYAVKKYELGQSGKIEKNTALLHYQKLQQEKNKTLKMVESVKNQLRIYTGADIKIDDFNFRILEDNEFSLDTNSSHHPMVLSLKQEAKIVQSKSQILKAERKPEFVLGYFAQSIKGSYLIDGVIKEYGSTPNFQGIQLGMGVSIFGKPKSLERANEIEAEIQMVKSDQIKLELEVQSSHLKSQLELEKNNILFYELQAIPNTESIIKSSTVAYERGDIGHTEYYQTLHLHYQTQMEYLVSIKNFNLLIFELQYLSSNKN